MYVARFKIVHLHLVGYTTKSGINCRCECTTAILYKLQYL